MHSLWQKLIKWSIWISKRKSSFTFIDFWECVEIMNIYTESAKVKALFYCKIFTKWTLTQMLIKFAPTVRKFDSYNINILNAYQQCRNVKNEIFIRGLLILYLCEEMIFHQSFLLIWFLFFLFFLFRRNPFW